MWEYRLGYEMEEKIEQAYLYDFYGELLNEHQRKIYEDFVFNDLSLGESRMKKESAVRVYMIW